MKGLRRMLAKQGRTLEKQAEPLREEDLKAIVANAKLPRQLPSGCWETKEKAEQRGVLDIALACVMRDAGLRRGEAAALQWRDVTRMEDGTGRIRVRRSKDRPRRGRSDSRHRAPSVQPRRGPTGGTHGRELVFGLGSRQITNRLRKAAQAAGLANAERVSGHSGRVGLAQRMVETGSAAGGDHAPGTMDHDPDGRSIHGTPRSRGSREILGRVNPRRRKPRMEVLKQIRMKLGAKEGAAVVSVCFIGMAGIAIAALMGRAARGWGRRVWH